MDYVEYACLDDYLFKTINRRFAEQGYLNAFDFFSMVIWKSNRSKSKIARRISRNLINDIEASVKLITTRIADAPTPKEKLKILWGGGFRLPMASAILTVLYPEQFTVYDYRVRGQLGIKGNLDSLSNFELVWAGYQDYKKKVIAATPSELSLREKDLYLWGKSRYEQLIDDIARGFSR